MYLTAFSFLVKLITWLSGVSGWLHDRHEEKVGAMSEVNQNQHAAIKALQVVLAAQTVRTKSDLQDKLKKGEL